MSSQNKSFDKVNMSLDEIIKLNRNQNRQNRFSANRNINGKNNNNNNNNRKNFQNGNSNNKNNNFRRYQQRPQQQQNRQPVNNKPYGMLNKSKAIQKRSNFPKKQNVMIINQNNQPQMGRKFPRNLANRRRRLANTSNGAPQRLFNRFGSGARNKFQNGQKKTNNNFNKSNQQQNKVKRFRQMSTKSVVAPKRLQQLRQPRVANVKNKIVMQSARKNVMKAKRLLAKKTTAKKGPIQQIMTQRYAKNLGLIQANRKSNPAARPAQKQQKQNQILRVSINNKLNRAKQSQKKTIQKVVKTQFKKPILNRNRNQQQGQSSAGRKVFF